MKKRTFLALMLLFTLATTCLTSLTFTENWNSQSFDTNNWTFEPDQSNWNINIYLGNIARFSGFPQETNYNVSLTSQSFDATDSETLTLEILAKGVFNTLAESENMFIELSVNNGEWTYLGEVERGLGNFMDPPTLYVFELNEAVGNQFKIRFRNFGEDTANFMFWDIHKVLIYDENYVPPAIVTGTVYDENENPLNNVFVSQGNNTVSTNWNGLYTIEADTESGEPLVFSSFGFQRSEVDVTTLTPGETYEVDVVLDYNISNLEPINFRVHNVDYSRFIRCNLRWDNPAMYNQLHYNQYIPSFYYDPMSPSGNELIVTKYELPENTNLAYIKMIVKAPHSQDIEISIFGEDDGLPTVNPIFEPIIFNFNPLVANAPEWIYVPVNINFEEATTVYAGARFNIGNSFCVGMVSSDDSNSYDSFENGTDWYNLGFSDAAIKLIVENNERNIIESYKLYRNNEFFAEIFPNENTLTYSHNFLLQDFNEYNYHITAVYDNGESIKSNTISVKPYEFFIRTGMWEDFVDVTMFFYHNNRDYDNVEIYRNDELLVSLTSDDSIESTNVYHRFYYEDYDLVNNLDYEYYAIIYLENGDTIVSNLTSIKPLLGARNITVSGNDNGVLIEWDCPNSRELLGYIIVKDTLDVSGIIQETSFTDTDVEFGEIYRYYIITVYDTEHIISVDYSVIAGPPVYHTPSTLDGDISQDKLYISWNNTDPIRKSISKNLSNVEAGYDAETYVATTIFEPWDIPPFTNCLDLNEILFFPITEGDYTVKMYLRDYVTGELTNLVYNETVYVDNPGEWHSVDIYYYLSLDANRFKIEIHCENGAQLAYDKADSPNHNANLLTVNGEETNLLNYDGITGNWKINVLSLKPVLVEIMFGQTEDYTYLYPVLTGFNIYQNNELIDEISYTDSGYELDIPLEGDHTFTVTAVYLQGESGHSEAYVYETTSVSDGVAQPMQVKLNQNYPNPFNPTTNISFYIPESQDVELSIFNVKGQLIKKLVSGELEKGHHNILWNGKNMHSKDVASGIYFYRLKTKSHNQVKKMIMMK